jgi:hypothetical protein
MFMVVEQTQQVGSPTGGYEWLLLVNLLWIFFISFPSFLLFLFLFFVIIIIYETEIMIPGSLSDPH